MGVQGPQNNPLYEPKDKGVQSNPLYKQSENSHTNPLYKGPSVDAQGTNKMEASKKLGMWDFIKEKASEVMEKVGEVGHNIFKGRDS